MGRSNGMQSLLFFLFVCIVLVSLVIFLIYSIEIDTY